MAATAKLRMAPTSSIQTRQQQDPQNLPHDNAGPQFNIAIWLLTGFAAVFLCLRLYCKRIRRKALWWDDYVLIAAFVALIAQTSLLSVCVSLGFGRHSWDITDWYHYLIVANVTGVCSITAAAWSKTSFAITLLRFSDGWIHRFVWFIIISVNLTLGLSGLFTYVQCWPISMLWDSTVQGKCWPPMVIVYYNSFSSAYSGTADIVLALLPWWIINRRSLTRRERIGVSVAMSMGVFAGITSIVKVTTLWSIKSPDTYNTVSLMILATAETAVTIVAASIPVLRALIRSSIHAQSPPHFYHSYQSGLDGPHHTRNHSNRELLAAPSPALTTPSWKDSQAASEATSPGGTTKKSIWTRDTGESWLNSSSGLELASREDERNHGMRR